MRPLSGGSRQPLAPEQAEEGSGELWVQGLPNQTLREATLARPQHEQSGDVPAGVTHCSKEVDPGGGGRRLQGDACAGALCGRILILPACSKPTSFMFQAKPLDCVVGISPMKDFF